MYGFYIHGESVYEYTDVSMKEFQHNLLLESQGNMPARGLGGQGVYQTYEVYISPYLRHYLYACYSQLFLESQRSHRNLLHAVHPASWHFLGFTVGLSKIPHVFPQAIWSIKDSVNHAFQACVSRSERIILQKSILQKLFAFPPNIMHMNGSQNDGKSTKDLFFLDDVLSYGSALMLGLDFDLFVLYSTFFAVIESSLGNIYVSMLLTFIVEVVIRWYRKHEGMVNLSTKMIIDGRLFV
ncbi:unnamed protein product [Phytomonas sp. EM1]|nr:unnamed protein product [Phytomonas sp. EM1]|eukprot:CCW60187.1 unnamed protein product [Phytomonas sp. isolate EM1]